MAKEYKTPEYQRRQVKKYNANHDKMQVILEKGELQKFRMAGIDNKVVRDLLIAEYEHRMGIEEKYVNDNDTNTDDDGNMSFF